MITSTLLMLGSELSLTAQGRERGVIIVIL